MEELMNLLKELREEKRSKNIKPELITLTSIKVRYGKDPLPELRELWSKGMVRDCKTLNDLAFYYYGE